MRPAQPTPPRPAIRKWPWLFLAGVAFLTLLGALSWFGAKQLRPAAPASSNFGEGREEVTAEYPRLTFATPYRNVRPEVRFVGDQVCAECHPSQAETYRQHPMGQSLGPISRVASVQRYDQAARNPFEVGGIRYWVEHRDARVWHHETRYDPQGHVLAETTEEVQYVMGSGMRAQSYLIDHDGFLFQSPITWYPQKGTWDLSPGFQSRAERFERPVGPECLFCHVNYAFYRDQANNGYRPPIFRGYTIGCERCHGPGELHVASRERGQEVEGLDETIVNPGRLPPALRDAVCQQCHLEGDVRIVRRGRQVFDYRPGLPLDLFWSVFVQPREPAETKIGSSVEQLSVSHCFRASKGKLGCISCHDPHAVPAPQQRLAHYRSRCLQCHQDFGCSLPLARRQAAGAADNCIACHMPRSPSDAPHVAISDHRILRQPAVPNDAARHPLREQIPLVHFHKGRVDLQDREAARDLGVAVTKLALQAPGPGAKQFCLRILPFLEGAVQAWPDDLPAREALAYVLSLQGRTREALSLCEGTLAQAPDSLDSLELAARLARHLKDGPAALTYRRRAVAVNPWWSYYRVEFAKLLAEQQQWPEALQECQNVLRRNPANAQARAVLVAYYAHQGDKDRARAEWATVVALDAEHQQELWRWVTAQAR